MPRRTVKRFWPGGESFIARFSIELTGAFCASLRPAAATLRDLFSDPATRLDSFFDIVVEMNPGTRIGYNRG